MLMNVIDWRDGTNTCLDSQTQRRTAVSLRIFQGSHQRDCCVKSCIVCFTWSQHRWGTFLSNYWTCWMKCLHLWASRGKEEVCVLGSYSEPDWWQAIKSHSGWQKPNMPLTLSFWNSDLNHSGARGGDRTTSCFQDLFCRHAALPPAFSFWPWWRAITKLLTKNRGNCLPGIRRLLWRSDTALSKLCHVWRCACWQRTGRVCLHKRRLSPDTRQSNYTALAGFISWREKKNL